MAARQVIDTLNHRTTFPRLSARLPVRYTGRRGLIGQPSAEQAVSTPEAGEWIHAADAAQLPEGGALGVRAGGHPIAVFRQGGRLFATDSLCTHAFVPLEDGVLDAFEIECPVHQARFDIRTGACTAFPARHPLRTFRVREDGASIEVFIPLGLAPALRVRRNLYP